MTELQEMFYSSYSDLQVTIQVCGGKYHQNQRRSNYTLTVPYSCLSQTIQRIHRTGGRITGIARQEPSLITAASVAPTSPETPPVAAAVSLQTSPELAAKATAVPATFLESPTAIPAIPALSRGCQKRRRSQLPGTIRRKNRRKTRTKAKVYLLG